VPSMSKSDQALVSFMIGSPQAFIEGARSLRDLWSGSFLVSWLAAKAMRPILDDPQLGPACFVTPHVDLAINHQLLAALGKPSGDVWATLSSIPNKFCLMVPADQANKIRDQTLHAAREAWHEIGDKVHGQLAKSLNAVHPDWDRLWSLQLNSFFEFFAVAMPLISLEPKDWNDEWNRLGRLMDTLRSVRHVPDYFPTADEQVPAKCSLLGSYEQMGPANLQESRRFWEVVASGNGIGGTRLQKTDRLCAVSLVKRFAWPVVLSAQTKLPTGELRFSDTATVAAKEWLRQAKIDPTRVRREQACWNGQWLHWDRPSQVEDEEPCPPALFDRIRDSRQKDAHGVPPVYYALLHLDGDNMGRIFTGDAGPKDWGVGRERYAEITKALTNFGQHVDRIVRDAQGELIYCGGDDILAILPTAFAVECAHQLNQAFGTAMRDNSVSISGGLAVAHYKEDLRYALQVARKAEKSAKRIDRTPTAARKKGEPKCKRALAVAVCRHSGEHSSFVMGWNQAEEFNGLVQVLKQVPITDRWTYKLCELATVLGTLPQEAVRGELERLLSRAEYPSEKFKADFIRLSLSLWDTYFKELTGKGRTWLDEDGAPETGEILKQFVILCQSASFMARGRD
jgi:CRISPR-associated protein Cmr2